MRLNTLLNYYEPESKPMDTATEQRIMSAVHQQIPVSMPNARLHRPTRMGVLVAVLAVVFSFSVAAAVLYSRNTQLLANEWTFAGEYDREIEEEAIMSEEQLAYIDSRTYPVDLSATDSGITVTLESITCTNHRLYFSLGYMSEKFPPDKYNLLPVFYDYYWTNPSYGSVLGQKSLLTSGADRLDFYTWRSIPDDACITDGNTVLELQIRKICYAPHGTEYSSVAELPYIEGNWSLSIPIPEVEASPEFTVETTILEETFGIPYADILITSSGCRLITPSDHDMGTGVYAGPYRVNGADIMYYTLEFYLKDGTKIPNFGSEGCIENGEIETIIDWLPIDPATIDHMTVFDGETEVTLPVIPK